MKIAYMPDTHFGTYDEPTPSPEATADASEHLMRECELAEEVGFDGLWFPERHARPETYHSSTVTLMAAAAARTKKVDLVSTVLMPTFHHPVHLAEQLANIDVLSRGRLTLGAGVGYHADYFRLFGVPEARKGKRFEEAMQVIDGVWTQERFSFKGEFYEFDDVYLSPKPYQRPRPKIWIGAFAEKPIERSLDWDGWVWWFPTTFEEMAVKVDEMREKADKRGKKDWTFATGLEGWIGDDEAKVQRDHGHRWVRERGFYEDMNLAPDTAREAQAEMERAALTLGTKQKWIDRLGAIREIVKPDYVGIRTRTPRNDPHHYPTKDDCLECIERLGEVVRALR